MAIYSLRMTSVGKSTQAQPFTAAAHIKYITRKAAVTQVLAERMPATRRQAIAWMKREEREDRKNARLIDKITLALPRELSAAEAHTLVRTFAETLTQGRASWLAAFHTKGKDKANPHCHLVLRDRDVGTGRRVMYLSAGMKEAGQRRQKRQSAPTTLKVIRELWAQSANAALAAAGRTETIDHRSLTAQGIDRPAQVHEGPNVRAMHRRGVRARSRDRVVRRHPFRRGQRGGTRVVRYATIDQGLTRVEYNASLRQVEGRSSARAADARHAAADRSAILSLAQSTRGSGPAVSTQTIPVHGPSLLRGTSPPAPPPPRSPGLMDLLRGDHAHLQAKPRTDRDRDKGRGR